MVLTFIPESFGLLKEQQPLENGYVQGMRESTVKKFDQYLLSAGNILKDYSQIFDQVNTFKNTFKFIQAKKTAEYLSRSLFSRFCTVK